MKLARIWWRLTISTNAGLLCAGCEFAASDLDQDVKLGCCGTRVCSPYFLGDAFIDYSGDCDIAVCTPYGAGQ